MKKSAIFSLVFNLCAIAMFITGIVLFSREANTTLGTTFVSGGFVFLLLGIYLTRRGEGKK